MTVATLELAGQTTPNGTWREETRRLMWQALPNIGTSVLRLSMGLADFVMVSQLGTDAQAAVSPATILCFIFIAVGMAIAGTVTTFASQAVGRGEPREAAAYAWQSMYLSAFFAAFSLPLMFCIAPLFDLFGHAPAVRDMEVAYCRIGVWSIGPAILSAGLEGFFNAVKRPVIGTISISVALLINIIGNYALIFGHFGFPALGIAGAALATVFGWCVRAAIMLLVFLGPTYARSYGTRETYGVSLPRLRGLVHVGWPTSVQWVLDIGAWFLFMTAIMGYFGTAAMAAANIALQYMHFSFMPAVGIAIALCALVGHAIGEGRPELAVRRTRIGLVMVCGYMGLAGLVFFVGRYWLMDAWSDDAAVIELGAIVMIWAGVFQVFDGFGIVYNNALRGAGDTRWPTVAFVITSWGVFMGGGTVLMRLAPQWGIHGPWLACTVYIILLGIALGWRFERGPWREIRLFDAKSDRPSAVSDQPGPEMVASEPAIAECGLRNADF